LVLLASFLPDGPLNHWPSFGRLWNARYEFFHTLGKKTATFKNS